MPSVLVGVDRDGRVTQWNRQAEEVTGVSVMNARSRHLADLFPRLMKQIDNIKAAIRERRVLRDLKVPMERQHETRYEDVTIFPLTASGVEGAVIRIDDVTQQVRLEEMMIQSEKMLSVGGLAAGMAHEVNNPLAFVLRVSDDNAWVRVEIEDNGSGMDERTRRRIFEPFFTTKPVGQGTGLGLSVPYFIVTEDHGGEMSIHAAEGGGTRFVIRLPKAGKG